MPAETLLWAQLRGRRFQSFKFVRQAPIGPYVADFLCRSARLIVEVDGATHATDAEVAHDARRAVFLSAEGYRVLRVNNDEVYSRLDGVLETILAAHREPPLAVPHRFAARPSSALRAPSPA